MPSCSPLRPVGAPGGAGGTGRLDDQLCFALYSAANAMQRSYAPLLKRFGLTYVQYLILLVLWETDNVPVGAIGRRLYLDSGTLTPVLRRLERLGYVSRRRSSADEREVHIALTASGIDLQRDMDALRDAVATKASLDGVAFATLRDALRALRTALIR